MQAVMNAEELSSFMMREFPQVSGDFAIEQLTEDGIVMRLKVAERHLRPGGTVSGPNIFALADVAVYLAILSRIGPVALAVTTSGGIDFLRKPEAGRDLICEARLLKLGRVLAVGDVLIRSDGLSDLVARANMTYSIPPSR
ncbi:PaaI family thioesterase [Defluviimonas sp. WL0002]|uniref:PaaI family thioesterase n=1 Tax=Albidovulum marisflavi TaxID=2984159 RepID=A0ABT2ZH13_9RHOB|nr:PaaI family thioesterase [Defluviimonas sp. WL0002]MCV2870433.1 PaaI family thioesterase [Defluviimonas sp. WL0002]